MQESFRSYKEKFITASRKETILYSMLAIGIIGAVVLLVYVVDRYKHIILLILLLWIFFKIEKCYNSTTIPQQECSVFVDENAIYDCLYESVSEIHDILNLAKPISVRSIVLFHAQLSDGFPRFFIKLRKNNFSVATTTEEVAAVLSEEISRVFMLRRNEFISDISGLYLETVKDCNDYFEVAIIPVTSQTYDYINRKILKESSENNDGARGGIPYDGKF